MRLAIIQSETRFIGGIEKVTEALLSSQAWFDVEPYIIFLRPGMLVEEVARSFPQARTKVIAAGRFRQFTRTVSSVASIARQLRAWRIDVVLSQGFHAQCYGGLAARLAGVKNVFWCHALRARSMS